MGLKCGCDSLKHGLLYIILRVFKSTVQFNRVAPWAKWSASLFVRATLLVSSTEVLISYGVCLYRDKETDEFEERFVDLARH